MVLERLRQEEGARHAVRVAEEGDGEAQARGDDQCGEGDEREEAEGLCALGQ